jgi:hypothetical protein
MPVIMAGLSQPSGSVGRPLCQPDRHARDKRGHGNRIVIASIRQGATCAIGDLRTRSRHWAPDLVYLHRAHALVVGFGVESADFETRQVVHEESIDAHAIESAHIASEQVSPLLISEINCGQRLRWIGLHCGAEGMIAQNFSTKMVDGKD